MGYHTESTDWPDPDLPAAVKDLIDQYFRVMDDKSPKAGDTLADNVCSPDCHLALFGGGAQGTEGVICRISCPQGHCNC
jgi:hypothetical protein